LGLFENWVRRRLFGPKSEDIARSKRDCIMRNFIICSLSI
jgi:hypothetical protein